MEITTLTLKIIRVFFLINHDLDNILKGKRKVPSEPRTNGLFYVIKQAILTV